MGRGFNKWREIIKNDWCHFSGCQSTRHTVNSSQVNSSSGRLVTQSTRHKEAVNSSQANIKPQLTPVDQLYSNYCTLPIHLLHKQKILELVHTALFRATTLPDVYHNYFVINRDVHSHDTRQRNDLLIRYVKKSFNMKSVQYSGSALWNCLPLMLKEQMSKKSF